MEIGVSLHLCFDHHLQRNTQSPSQTAYNIKWWHNETYKKGIALNFDEWEAFKSCLSNIDSGVRRVQSQQVVTEPVLDLNMFYQGGAEAFPTISSDQAYFDMPKEGEWLVDNVWMLDHWSGVEFG